MADARTCEQCGTAFEPRREHERFCSACCRIAWNSQNTAGQQTKDAALGWSVTAMADTAQRLARAEAMDLPQALALVSEAVWWVTIVDATMIRYHSGAYDRALAVLEPATRRTTEGTFAGLRFVRNQMGYRADPADFIQPQPGPGGTSDAPVAAWTWKPVPAPALELVPPRSRPWVVNRHQEYRTQLADRPIGETITQATAFLAQVYATAARPSGTPATTRSARP